MKKCVARAIYAEIAMAADDWSYVGLSRRLSTHADYDIDTLEEKLRKLRDGSRAPTLESWAFVAEAFPQVNLPQWIEHPLFLLLNRIDSHLLSLMAEPPDQPILLFSKPVGRCKGASRFEKARPGETELPQSLLPAQKTQSADCLLRHPFDQF